MPIYMNSETDLQGRWTDAQTGDDLANAASIDCHLEKPDGTVATITATVVSATVCKATTRLANPPGLADHDLDQGDGEYKYLFWVNNLGGRTFPIGEGRFKVLTGY